MNDRLCVCGLDTVVLVGDICSFDEFNELLELHSSPSSIGLFQLRLYERNLYASDGTKISAGYKGGNPRRVRLEISPSKANPRVVATLLSHLEDVRVQRCDIALDYIGYDIQAYEFHCSNLGLAHHRLARNPFPHSYVYGEGDSHRRVAIARSLRKNEERKSILVDHLLDGVLDKESYAMKVNELDNERTTLELRLKELELRASDTFLQVERLLRLGAGAAFAFQNGSMDQQREVLANVLFNLVLRDREIVSYQHKRPFGALERDAKGAFLCSWSG